MRFRPCIDIHNGKVKQIVGSSLSDSSSTASENFVSDRDAEWYASLYREDGLSGGHVILLNPASSEFYGETKRQAIGALKAYPQGMQAGGGINPSNADEFLDAGASHVIVTSYVMSEGKIHYGHLEEMRNAVGKERLVLDLSCRKRNGVYYVVTDRWQKFTDQQVDRELLEELAGYCDEFLVHAVDVEGKNSGIEEELVEMLAGYSGNTVTYAGGVRSYDDLAALERIGKGQIDVTIGSALDLFGGKLNYTDLAGRFS